MLSKILSGCLLIILSGFNVSRGQEVLDKTVPDLSSLFSRLLLVKSDSQRIAVNDSIEAALCKSCQSTDIFKYRFNNIRNLGQITSPDSAIKILTWNLVLSEQPGKYFCYLIHRNKEKMTNDLFRLKADYSEKVPDENYIYGSSNWYGALFYDIRKLPMTGGEKWVLIGLDLGNRLITRKIIDVLSISPNNELSFGDPRFLSGDTLTSRVIFQYSAYGAMTLRFSSDTSMVFDHLVPFEPGLTGKMQFYGADYSFDAFVFEKNMWRRKRNVDVRNDF